MKATSSLSPNRAGGTRTAAILALAASSFIYATEAIFIRELTLPAIAIGALRLAAAAAIGLALTKIRHEGWPSFRLMQWRRLLLLGSLAAVNSVCFIFAIQRTDVGVAVVITFTWPLWVAVFYRVLGVHRTSGRTVVALVACVAGVGLLALRTGTAPGPDDALGIGAAIIVSLSMACMVLVERSTNLDLKAGPLYVAKSGIAAVLVMPLGLSSVAEGGIDTRSLAILAVLGLISAVGGTLFLMGMRVLSAAETGALSLLEPLLATGLAAVILGEVLQIRAVLGMALMLLAGFWIVMMGDSEAPFEQPDAIHP